LIADKGYHGRAVLKDLDGSSWQTRIAEPKPKDIQRWHGDLDARRAVYGNRARLRSGVGTEAFKLRAEKAERSFQHTLDRGGMRHTWLRGRENVPKRYLMHVAAYNLGLVMRALLGAGTPKGAAARGAALLWLAEPTAGLVVLIVVPPDTPPEPTRQRPVELVLADALGHGRTRDRREAQAQPHRVSTGDPSRPGRRRSDRRCACHPGCSSGAGPGDGSLPPLRTSRRRLCFAPLSSRCCCRLGPNLLKMSRSTRMLDWRGRFTRYASEAQPAACAGGAIVIGLGIQAQRAPLKRASERVP